MHIWGNVSCPAKEVLHYRLCLGIIMEMPQGPAVGWQIQYAKIHWFSP